ncbi:restriction endonuclease subunit S [Bacillus wiedmannii]|uniref:restriction endonuclease subunit S n=1 Tax=Bacillus wiedmannii TaxID=1890302 RepID=UPI000BF67688|nr:restriction endonuclease subunit S [Bacillus wiedmannii]PGD70268.1 hypothetical protein COM44_12595 [Bacillus wiedmannii]
MKIFSSSPSIVFIDELEQNDKISAQYYSVDFINFEKELLQNSIIQFKDIIKEYNGGPMGFQLHTYDYKEFGVPLLRTKDMKEMSIQLEDPIFISEEKNDELKNSKTYPGDLIISKTGQIGVCSLVPDTIKKANLNQALCNIRVDESEIDKYFLVVFLNTKYGQYQLLREGTGKAVQPGLTRDEINSLKIFIPSSKIQKYIGDKVRRAEELREEAKQLRKEMIVTLYSTIELPNNFEGENEKFNIVYNENLDDIRIDAIYYMKKYVEYEEKLREKQLVSLGNIIIDSNYGASISADYRETGIPFLRGLNLNENEIDDNVVYLNESVKSEIGNAIVNEGDILITRSGSVGITAVVDKRQEGYAFGSFMIKLVVDKEMWNPYYISAFLNSFWGKWQVERQKNGAVQQNINLQEIGRIMIPKLDLDKQNIFEMLIKQYIEKDIQSKQLIQQAKQDVEDLIESNFNMSKLDDTTTESR